MAKVDFRAARTLCSTVALASVLVSLAGCDCEGGSVDRRRDTGTSAGNDAGPPGLVDIGVYERPDAPLTIDTGPPPVEPNPEAFWADDPPPVQCLEDGSMSPPPDPPGGTPECPDDKNREGCRCDTVGEMAPCWPGRRVNRNRGICHDGTTTCVPYDEFTGVWGPCMGAVLPVEGARLGPQACQCFSEGRWAIENLSPCFVDYGAGRGTYAVSTYVSGGAAHCPTLPSDDTPPAEPMAGTVWSGDSLTVDCAGRFNLCYTLRAGNAASPSPSDCMLARVCTGDVWYPEPGVAMRLPDLPSWSSSDSACATQFATSGGYGEMSVVGLSLECEPIDDGTAAHGEYVFNRVNYCPLSCATDPTGPGCTGCMMGGSGSF
ncbi:MAG: hypothetical protein K1X94_20350 [Sandaracinaceae bacterium]|nr:hypothetical protein [Sandaracinaceae bacterium]